MSETPTPPVKGQVQVTDRNSPFFGKLFKVIEEDAEHVVALVEVGAEKLFHIFTKAQVTPAQNVPVVTTIANQAASNPVVPTP